MGFRSNLLVVGLVVVGTCAANCDKDALLSDEVTPIPVRDESKRLPEKNPRAEDVMAAKLDHAEQILAGLVTHDFEKIARSAESLRNLAGAAYFQQSLTATCIACHDYMRDEDLKSK